MKTISVRTMTMVAILTAVLAVLSQLSIPMPSGMPITLQTLGVALVGCILGVRPALWSLACYLLLGAVGLPVFAGFGAGPAKLIGVTGGYLWGFFLLAAACGVGARLKNRFQGYALGLAGLIACHAVGILQFALVSGATIQAAAWTASIPYLPKDILSVLAAYYLGKKILARIR